MGHHNSEKIQSDLKRARGLGSAHHGTGHWMAQRITAISNIPLTLWFIYSIISLVGADHETFSAWLASPVNAVLMILFVISVFYHAALGLQVVIEDYISCEGMKFAKIIGVKLGLLALGVACVFSILKLAL